MLKEYSTESTTVLGSGTHTYFDGLDTGGGL